MNQTRPIVVVVRIAEGETEAATTNAIGTVNGRKTGMKAMLATEAELGVRPRILAVPGHDTDDNRLLTRHLYA